jgi:hypothetical protein
MSRKSLAVAAAIGSIVGLTSYGVASAAGAGAASGPSPYASGTQTVSSGPHVYDQTTDEYAGSWNWAQNSASYDYYWYVFHSDGTLAANGHNPSGGGGSWSGAANIYYFKEYNNEPLGSGHINILSVSYCC